VIKAQRFILYRDYRMDKQITDNVQKVHKDMFKKQWNEYKKELTTSAKKNGSNLWKK